MDFMHATRRINPKGEQGIFRCVNCYREGTILEMLRIPCWDGPISDDEKAALDLLLALNEPEDTAPSGR